MLSSQFDEVSKNAIWTEHCVREAKVLRINESFGGITSPSKMIALAEKPNRTTPQSQPSPEALRTAQDTLKTMCTLNEDLTPQDKYELPITGNQEYGWFHKPLASSEPLFHHPKNGCDVTQYADAYFTMTRRSPYAKKNES